MADYAEGVRKPAARARTEADGGAGGASLRHARLEERPEAQALEAAGRMLNARPALAAQLKSSSALGRSRDAASAIQRKAASPANRTGLPDRLKTGVEALSGLSMDDVKVHYGSSAPARIGAAAFTRGSEIHVGPGQEKHLAHEAWHVVQQKQGRVKPTLQMKGVEINDDAALEREADLLGGKALGARIGAGDSSAPPQRPAAGAAGVRQLKPAPKPTGTEAKTVPNDVFYGDGTKNVDSLWETAPVATHTLRADVLKAAALKGTAIGAETDSATGNKWNPKKAEPDNQDTFNPFRMRFKGQYGPDNDRKDLDLDFHYGSKWCGYVVHVRDTGSGLDQEMHEVLKGQQTPQGKFKHVHAKDMNSPDALATKAGDADAATKIAAEGARWKVVADHAGGVRDNSRFFTNQSDSNAFTVKLRYVEFPTLWKSWKETFGMAWGIENKTVAAALRKDSISITTVKGVKEAKVAEMENKAASFDRHFSVDEPPPRNEADLKDTMTVSFVYFTKQPPALVLSQISLEKEIAAASAEVARKAKIRGVAGYAGKETFGFLCSLDEKADLSAVKKYGYKSSLTQKLAEYPKYRDSAVEALGKKQVAAQAIGKGEAVFEEEREVYYRKLLKTAVDRMKAYLKRKAEEDEDEAAAELDPETLIEDKFPRGDGKPIPLKLLETNWKNDEAVKAIVAEQEPKTNPKEAKTKVEADDWSGAKGKKDRRKKKEPKKEEDKPKGKGSKAKGGKDKGNK